MQVRLREFLAGSIPAWAGETLDDSLRGLNNGVYPRVGGGNGGIPAVGAFQDGLSPRGRGKLNRAGPPRRWPGSIPAWAGETVILKGNRRPAKVYPRVGGGNHSQLREITFDQGLSPRGRGKPAMDAGRAVTLRSIPAWAGETGKW